MIPSWWRRRSLRARLTAASTLIIAVGMTVATAGLVLYLHASLTAALGTAVSQRAQDVANAMERGQPAAALTASGDATVVQVVTSGRVVAGSANVDGEPPLFTVLPIGTGPTVRDVAGVPLGDNGDYLVAAVAAGSANGPTTVYAGAPTTQIQQSVTELIVALAVGGPVLVAVFGFLAWLLVGRALRPVEMIRRQAAATPGTDLHRRLTPPATRDELHRLATTFNDLLARIESATSRQRQFVADAAHELRSPIAALRAQLDIETRHPQLPISPDQRRELTGDVERLARLVDDLLALARLDAHAPLRRVPVDLDDLVLAEIRRSRPRSPCHIDAHAVSAGRVLGDPDALDRVVRNLLDNAIRHAHHVVTATLHADPTTVTLTVADDGDGIPPANRQRVFHRFTRLDQGRDRHTGGTGLGLAIVREVITAHHGTVHIEDNTPGARLVVTLPTGAD